MDILDVATQQRLEQLYDDIGMLEYHLSTRRHKKAEKGLEKLIAILQETIEELDK